MQYDRSLMPGSAGVVSLQRPVQTPEWLGGLVDSEHFPNVHGSYTREEALNMESQVMTPAYDSDA
jgi:hypothetical protein